MKKVYSKDAPYKGTKIAVERSKEDSNRILRSCKNCKSTLIYRQELCWECSMISEREAYNKHYNLG